MKKAVEIKPALLLFGQALMGILFGILGVAVAAPFIVCVQEIADYLYIERSLRKK